MKEAAIRDMARARKVINRLAISQEALWIDGFLAGLEAAKAMHAFSCEASVDMDDAIAEARKAAGKP